MISERLLFVVQRKSAMVLAPLVIVHLVLIMLAVEGGLSAGEILNRTRGSIGWAVFYVLFVIAVSLHAPIGMRNILREWTSLSWKAINGLSLLLGLLLLGLGLRAVVAVVA